MTQLDDICFLSAVSSSQCYTAVELSPVEVTKRHLARLGAPQAPHRILGSG